MTQEILQDLEPTDLPPEHPVRAVDAYWRELAAGTGIPTREVFNPLRVPAALPWLYLFERLPSGTGDEPCTTQEDYVLILFGASTLSDGGKLAAGMRLSELFSGPLLERRLDEFARVHREAAPVLSRTFITGGPRPGNWVRGLFPFRSAAGTPQVLVVMIPDLNPAS
ncbi:MAG: hypothetical protein D6807_00010 [Alphaproteobacteria bacterium]|nr:MAG: hypothetical protein D6807_00010 [Alphaproteobacteria bacterium]